nr:putative reverse transcriptase domain-containing protein [Tanacetum cinerariifolium]
METNQEVHGERPEGNLKQLKTMKVNESKLKDILVVREIPDVFLEDLSGLPPSDKAKILEAQREASKNTSTSTEMLKGLDKQVEIKEDGGLYLAERIWVPVYDNLRTLIMNEAHAMRFPSGRSP